MDMVAMDYHMVTMAHQFCIKSNKISCNLIKLTSIHSSIQITKIRKPTITDCIGVIWSQLQTEERNKMKKIFENKTQKKPIPKKNGVSIPNRIQNSIENIRFVQFN